MMNDIAVSIVCITYNHEKYIKDCLDGFLMQKTNFEYEIIVHDDASTDRTQRIIRDYELKNPKKIRVIYQNENKYSKGIEIMKEYISPLVRGKYVAICEGDDYWIDENKLQQQFDSLEQNKDCMMCVSKVQGVNPDKSTIIGCTYPNKIINNKMNLEEYLKKEYRYLFQTSSFFCRASEWLVFNNNPPIFRKVSMVGDVPLVLYMLTKGNISYIDSTMSNYRRLTPGSFGSRTIYDRKRRVMQSKSYFDMMNAFSDYIDKKYDCNIKKYEFDYEFIRGNYHYLLSKEMRNIFKIQKTKRKAFIILCYFFPFFDFLLTKKIERN